jgi:hypothetical protein
MRKARLFSLVVLLVLFSACDAGKNELLNVTDVLVGDTDVPSDSQVSNDDGGFEVLTDNYEVDYEIDSTGADIDSGDEVTSDAIGLPEISGGSVPYYPSPSFRFEQSGALEGNEVVLDVVAKDLGEVFGIALRIEWDTTLARLEDVELKQVFEQDGIYKAKEIRPGSLAIGMAHNASYKKHTLSGDVVVAKVTLKLLKSGDNDISFFEPRCLVVTRRLEPIQPVYIPYKLRAFVP